MARRLLRDWRTFLQKEKIDLSISYSFLIDPLVDKQQPENP